MSGPDETAALVNEITREYREHAAEAAAEHVGEDQAAEDLEEDPDCE